MARAPRTKKNIIAVYFIPVISRTNESAFVSGAPNGTVFAPPWSENGFLREQLVYECICHLNSK